MHLEIHNGKPFHHLCHFTNKDFGFKQLNWHRHRHTGTHPMNPFPKGTILEQTTFQPEEIESLMEVRRLIYRDGCMGFLLGIPAGELIHRATLKFDQTSEKINKARSYKSKTLSHPTTPLGNTSKTFINPNQHHIARTTGLKNRRLGLIFGTASLFSFLGSVGRGKMDMSKLHYIFTNK